MDLNCLFKINLEEVIEKLGFECSISPVTLDYCKTRLKNEGLGFLTVTLPKLSKAIIVSLEKGFFIRPTNFAWKGNTLVHFREHLDLIFDASGKLNRTSQVDPLCIMQLRQFCEYFYKLSMDFSHDEKSIAEEKFLRHDLTVPSVGGYDYDFVDQLRKDFETHYHSLSSASVHEILTDCPPRSGTGTYSRVRPDEYNQPWYSRRIYDCHAPRKWQHYSYARRLSKFESRKDFKDEDDRSQVLFVPKDSRGPRTIVREPFLSLGYQMSYNEFLSKKLEMISRHRINFQDQTVNQKLAASSSTNKELSTLDLENASDSVSYAIIRHIFRHSNGLLDFILNRTNTTVLPSGKNITLRKLSGMGSGLTFPTMSLLIHLSITRNIVNRTGFSYNYVRSRVYVYGDDIIVPSIWYDYSVHALTRVALSVNLDKSFHKGNFRESCGGDYYNGSDVSFVRCKLDGCKLSPQGTFLKVSGEKALLQLDAHSFELAKHGIKSLSDYYYSLIESKVGQLPFKEAPVPIIARFTYKLPEQYFLSNTLYKKIKCIMVVPRTYEATDCEEYFLSQALRESKRVTWKDVLIHKGRDHTQVSIPKEIRYRYATINPLALT